MTPRSVGVTHIVFALLFALIAAPGQAVLRYSGDINRDSVFDASDVVALVNALQDSSSTSGIQALINDANQDGQSTDDDVTYVVDIILGMAHALPLGGTVSTGVSIYQQETSFPGTEVNVPLVAASLWSEPEPPPADETLVPQRAASLWNRPEPPSAAEENVPPLDVSVWNRPAVPAATEADARQLGTPSYDKQ